MVNENIFYLQKHYIKIPYIYHKEIHSTADWVFPVVSSWSNGRNWKYLVHLGGRYYYSSLTYICIDTLKVSPLFGRHDKFSHTLSAHLHYNHKRETLLWVHSRCHKRERFFVKSLTLSHAQENKFLYSLINNFR